MDQLSSDHCVSQWTLSSCSEPWNRTTFHSNKSAVPTFMRNQWGAFYLYYIDYNSPIIDPWLKSRLTWFNGLPNLHSDTIIWLLPPFLHCPHRNRTFSIHLYSMQCYVQHTHSMNAACWSNYTYTCIIACGLVSLKRKVTELGMWPAQHYNRGHDRMSALDQNNLVAVIVCANTGTGTSTHR